MLRISGGSIAFAITAALLAGCGAPASPVPESPAAGTGVLARDPESSTFRFEGGTITLVDGHSQRVAAPGAATLVRTSIVDSAVLADLDGDGDEDAVLLLDHDPGGSGTFTYVAAAIREDGGFRGANSVLIGDRIAPSAPLIRNAVVEVSFADRAPGEPMAATPTVRRTKVLTWEGGALNEIATLGEDDRVVEGWVVVGHEVRSFTPCSVAGDLWLHGDSPAMAAVVAAHARAMPHAKPYTPVFVVLAGRRTASPADGFGADYAGAFVASEFLKVLPNGNCRSGLIVANSPRAGAVVASPLRVGGRARGTWFFEGDFPLVLEDARGNVIAEGYATARGEWMTEHFVPFEGSLEFRPPPASNRGTLILRKDNPSGRPELDASVEIPIFFR